MKYSCTECDTASGEFINRSQPFLLFIYLSIKYLFSCGPVKRATSRLNEYRFMTEALLVEDKQASRLPKKVYEAIYLRF